MKKLAAVWERHGQGSSCATSTVSGVQDPHLQCFPLTVLWVLSSQQSIEIYTVERKLKSASHYRYTHLALGTLSTGSFSQQSQGGITAKSCFASKWMWGKASHYDPVAKVLPGIFTLRKSIHCTSQLHRCSCDKRGDTTRWSNSCGNEIWVCRWTPKPQIQN